MRCFLFIWWTDTATTKYCLLSTIPIWRITKILEFSIRFKKGVFLCYFYEVRIEWDSIWTWVRRSLRSYIYYSIIVVAFNARSFYSICLKVSGDYGNLVHFFTLVMCYRDGSMCFIYQNTNAKRCRTWFYSRGYSSMPDYF